jgi:hypothetical protein
VEAEKEGGMGKVVAEVFKLKWGKSVAGIFNI